MEVQLPDPFPLPVPPNDEKCGGTGCAPATECFVCGYDSTITGCAASGCADLFAGMSTTFLGGLVSGFSSKLGLGSSESTLNVDLVVYKECSESTSCSTCSTSPTYIGQLGYIYHFCMGAFTFRGILTNHTYSEGSDGFRYRATLTDGRSIMGSTAVILNEIYMKPPVPLEHSVINVLYSKEKSVEDCEGEKKCKDFMKSGSNKKGIFLKKALEGIDKKQIKIPVSNICVRIDVSRLIPLISPEYRTTTAESSVLELINLACEESGHDFFCTIENHAEWKEEYDDTASAEEAGKSRNWIVIHPINYKVAPPPSGLFDFIELLAEDSPIISREYGQEMTFEKNKKLVFGDNYHYLTVVQDSSASGSSSTCSLKNSPSNRKVAVDTIAPIDASISSTSCTPP